MVVKRAGDERWRRAQGVQELGDAASIACWECRKAFTYEVSLGRRPKLCSLECKRRRRRRIELREKYGIELERYDALWLTQSGLCAICRGALLSRGDAFAAVDHDHVTGAVRGLLCNSCNLGIGQFRDDPDILLAAAQYVARHAGGRQYLEQEA